MKIYIFRHAQKSFFPAGDPGLTDYGKVQAEEIASWVQKNALPFPQRIYASPKLRAQQTFQALADTFNISLEIHNHLLERTHSESNKAFLERIQNFLNFCSSSNLKTPKEQTEECLFLCTHHDWIAEALNLIDSDTDLNDSKYLSWPPCQFMGFQLFPGDPIWKLIDFRHVTPPPS